jgi:hypothetical protein
VCGYQLPAEFVCPVCVCVCVRACVSVCVCVQIMNVLCGLFRFLKEMDVLKGLKFPKLKVTTRSHATY